MNLIDQIITTIEQWQKHLLTAYDNSNQQSTSMSAMEQAAISLGQRVSQLALTNLLEQSGTGYDRSIRDCACGSKQRFQRYAARKVRTLTGAVTYSRAYYRCDSCGESCFPLDEQINQSSREISPAVERAVALLSAHLSFIEAERVLSEVTGVEVSARQIETVAESIGMEAEQRQQQCEQEAASQGLAEACGPNRPQPRTFIVEMDGVQVGLNDGTWQEARCGVVYELSRRVEISQGRWELLKRHRCALRGDAASFRRRLWALCLRAGIRESDRVVVIADGAAWIDQTSEFLFPGALRILDYYHASERVWAVANARWGEATSQGRRWARARLSQLKAGEVGKVIGSMRKLRMKREEAEEVRAGAVSYLTARKRLMWFGDYRRAGLPIGSGAVESSCKQVVSARCKQAGMRWSQAGVDAILALRSFVLNERLDELCPKTMVSIDWAKAA
jgi:hypothetical protein